VPQPGPLSPTVRRVGALSSYGALYAIPSVSNRAPVCGVDQLVICNPADASVQMARPGPVAADPHRRVGALVTIRALPDLCLGLVSGRLEFLWTLSPLD
jgi:hypothetical protein